MGVLSATSVLSTSYISASHSSHSNVYLYLYSCNLFTFNWLFHFKTIKFQKSVFWSTQSVLNHTRSNAFQPASCRKVLSVTWYTTFKFHWNIKFHILYLAPTQSDNTPNGHLEYMSHTITLWLFPVNDHWNSNQWFKSTVNYC